MGKENQSRREFLGKVLGAAVFLAVNPIEVFLTPKNVFADGGNQTLGTFTVDLTLSKYAALKNVNGSVAISITGAKPATSIILTRTSGTQFEAVNRTCTHQGSLVNPYNASLQRIVCPTHGSEFLADGTLELGPATRPLPNYKTTYDSVNSPNTVLVAIPTLGVENGQILLAASPELYQNYPNPVTEKTTIRFALSYYAKVTLTVTDAIGHIIAVLHDGDLSEGDYSFDFDASIFPSGTYFYHLNAEGEVQTKQMTVVK